MARELTSSNVNARSSASGSSSHIADQAHVAITLHGKNKQNVGLVKIDVQFKVDRRAACLDIGDVEQPRIGSAGKADAERLAYGRARTVAASKIGRFAGFFCSVRPPEHRLDTVGVLIETDQLRLALHFDAQGVEPFDQQSLVGVLRENQCEGKGVSPRRSFATARVRPWRP